MKKKKITIKLQYAQTLGCRINGSLAKPLFWGPLPWGHLTGQNFPVIRSFWLLQSAWVDPTQAFLLPQQVKTKQGPSTFTLGSYRAVRGEIAVSFSRALNSGHIHEFWKLFQEGRLGIWQTINSSMHSRQMDLREGAMIMGGARQHHTTRHLPS